MNKRLTTILTFVLITSMLATSLLASAASTIKPSPAVHKKGTYFSTKKINWTTKDATGRIDLAKVSISGTSRGSYLNQLTKSACVITSMSMILRDMDVKTINKYYDFRLGRSDHLYADPFVVTMLNMASQTSGLKRDSKGMFVALPEIKNNRINGYRGNNIIVYVNSHAGSDITKHFGVSSNKHPVNGSRDAKIRTLIQQAKTYPHGVLVRFHNQDKGHHSLVMHGYTDINKNNKEEFDDLRFSDAAGGNFVPFRQTYTGNKAYRLEQMTEYWSFQKRK